MSVTEAMDLMSSALAEASPDGAPADAERYRDMLRDDRYRAAISLVESYPWPALAQAVRDAYRSKRIRGGDPRLPGSISLGDTEWWVDPRSGEVYPFVTEKALCEDCIGEGRWSEEIADARNRGALDMYAHGECPACQGSGEVEDLVALRELWDGNQLHVADDPLSAAVQLIIRHYIGLSFEIRDEIDLKLPEIERCQLPAIERPERFRGMGS